MSRPLAPLLLLAALVLSSAAAHAGEIVLYRYADFFGRSIQLQNDAQNFADLGFNDRANSISVHSGDWEVCTDAYFRGSCLVLRPGEYRHLPQDFLSRISSAREVTRASHHRYAPEPPRVTQRIEFFSARRFRGGTLTLTAAAPDLRSQGFNDVPASAIITGGAWEICSEPGFRGSCRVFPEGEHESLSWDLNHQVSSARPLAPVREALREAPRPPQPQLRPPQSRPQPVPQRPASASFFEGNEFRGRSISLRGPVPDFDHLSFNDRAESIRIDAGVWEVCTDANYRGECRRLLPGSYSELERVISRRISSARPLEDDVRSPREAPPASSGYGPNAL